MSNKDLDFIKLKWKQLESEDGVFQYRLRNKQRRKIEGKYNFFTELNTDRYRLRRTPHNISSFNEKTSNAFNFKNIKPCEKLLDISYKGSIYSFIINQSPLTTYHSLICPDVAKLQPQKISYDALEFCIRFLLSVDDRNFRIGYNSPGALASVNHLHLHLLYMERDLYIDGALLQKFGDGYAYRLHNTMPTEAICFLVNNTNTACVIESIHKLIHFFYINGIPHNIFITPNRMCRTKELKVFIFAREKYCSHKNLNNFNIAFCEFSGYVPIGDEHFFNSITEETVIEELNKQSGNIYKLIYEYLTQH